MLIGSILYGIYLNTPESYYLAVPGGFLGTISIFLYWKGNPKVPGR